MEPTPKPRMTKQKKVILEELKKLDTHPTARELCGIVRKRLPKISLGTVYRNLELMSKQGIIRKLEVSGAEMCFDGNPANHYHLRCVVCGRVADADLPLLQGLEDSMAQKSDFEIITHNLEFLGVCPRCQAERQKQRQASLN